MRCGNAIFAPRPAFLRSLLLGCDYALVVSRAQYITTPKKYTTIPWGVQSVNTIGFKLLLLFEILVE